MSVREKIKLEFGELREKCSKVLVFYVKIDELWDDDYKLETALRLLPFEQQTKIISKKFTADAKTSLANQLLQLFISCLITHQDDSTSLTFRRNQYGKPYLIDSSFSFSMSNQQGFTSMVIDLDNNEIGIDLAHVSDAEKFGNDYLSHFKDIFHQDELEILQNTDVKDLNLLFTEYWALKESYTKRLGVGLNGDLKSYNFKQVPILAARDDSIDPNVSNFFRLRTEVNWDGQTKLFIHDNFESELNINLALIEPKLVVSICGKINQTPNIIEVPMETIISFLEQK